MILTRNSFFIWLLGSGLVISMLPSHSLAQAIEGTVFVTARAIGGGKLQGDRDSGYYTDYTVEYIVTIRSAGVTTKFTTEGMARSLGSRSWYGYNFSESFEIVCGQPPEGVDEKVPANIVLRVQNSICDAAVAPAQDRSISPNSCKAFGIDCSDASDGYPGFASNELLIPGVTLADLPPPEESTGRVFNLFIHGRADGKNLCNNPSTDLLDQDNPLWWENKGPYWGRYGTKSPRGAGVPLTRYIGWDTEAPGGAYSTSGYCSAQTRILIALWTFCREPDSCNIYTHSTGGLVVAAYFADNEWAATYFNIARVQLMASAAGGSELALGTANLGSMGPSPELDASVNTIAARSHFNHNASGKLTYYTTSNLTFGVPLVWNGNPYLPGLDDGILANHSLCSINEAAMVTVRCKMGGGPMRFASICTAWGIPYPCYKKFYRWDPYYTIYDGGYFEGLFVAHAKAMEHYKQ